MAYQVVWSPRAIEDVEAIASFIAKDSVAYAAAVVQKILDTTGNLNKFPLTPNRENCTRVGRPSYSRKVSVQLSHHLSSGS
jgi:plasmid stabilization system protein ParE